MLDAYTVRKAVPRIVLAVIGINLSIYLCVVALDITTIVGDGMSQILNSAFIPDGKIQVDSELLDVNAENAVASGGIMALLVKGIIGIGSKGLLSALLPIITIVGLITLAVLFTLVIRQGLLIFLTVVSPIAIACFILPGTEKYFQKWFDLFSKTLMMYPIIAVLFAMSNVMASIILGAPEGASAAILNPATILHSPLFAQAVDSDSDAISTLKLFTGIIVIYAPLALIPFTFKLAGGALGAVFNAAQNASANTRARKSKGMSEGFAKGRAERNAKFRSGQLYEGTKFIPGSRRLARGANTVGRGLGTGFRGQYGIGAKGATAHTAAIEKASMDVMKSSEFNSVRENDMALQAGTYASDKDAFNGLQTDFNLSPEQAKTAVNAFKTSGLRFGDQATQFAAAKQLVSTGTGYDNIEQMSKTLGRASNGNAGTAASLAGFSNFEAKNKGRFDLAPGFGPLNKLVQGEAGIDGATAPNASDYDKATDDGWNAGSLYAHANAKPKNIERHLSRAQKLLTSNDSAERQRGAVMVEEFKSMLPNASGDVANRINAALDGDGTPANVGLKSLQGSHFNGFGNGLSGVDKREQVEVTAINPATGLQETRSEPRVVGQLTNAEVAQNEAKSRARTYERPDPNKI